MKIENFEVLAVDGDGTVQLLNIDMLERGIEEVAVWCMTDAELHEGQHVRGSFNFDPDESLTRGFPTFTLSEVVHHFEGRVLKASDTFWMWSIDDSGEVIAQGMGKSEEDVRSKVTEQIAKLDPAAHVWPGIFVKVEPGRFSYQPPESP